MREAAYQLMLIYRAADNFEEEARIEGRGKDYSDAMIRALIAALRELDDARLSAPAILLGVSH